MLEGGLYMMEKGNIPQGVRFRHKVSQESHRAQGSETKGDIRSIDSHKESTVTCRGQDKRHAERSKGLNAMKGHLIVSELAVHPYSVAPNTRAHCSLQQHEYG